MASLLHWSFLYRIKESIILSTMQTVSAPVQAKKVSAIDQLLVAALSGIFLFFLVAGASLIGFQFANAGKIYPGVSVAGIDMSGLTPVQAAASLSAQITYPQTGRIYLQDGQQAWRVTPADMGLYLDPETTVAQAFKVGRSSNLLENLLTRLRVLQAPINFPPVMVFDQRQAQLYFTNLSSQVNRPLIEANVGLNGTEVVVRAGQTGRELDLRTSLERVSALIQSMQDGVVQLAVIETRPVILDATLQAELARKILSQPLTLQLPPTETEKLGPWSFDVKTLASMLTVAKVQKPDGSANFEVTVDSSKLGTFLKNLAPSLARTGKNARFTFNDKTRQLEVIEHAVIGRALDVNATLKAVQQSLEKGEHSVPLVVTITNPPANDNTKAEELGIRELVRQEISYFYGSSTGRIQNITAAAAKFHGVLVPPGAVFSMSDTIGDISLDNGFAEALIIYNGRTVKGVGGGVCQVSTTLFRTAFFAGYPIVERSAHAYRVSYYEKVAGNKIDARLAGLDATVFVPLVDFKFKNDSSSWLLMETYVNPKTATLTWKFYSTNDGRKATWETTGLTNIVPAPDPVYRENPDLPKGKINHIDYAVEGADVAVTRTVTRDGKVILKDVIRTHYVPWPDQYEYGPGTELPNP
jgi:vancomycin resistance protein YoaR